MHFLCFDKKGVSTKKKGKLGKLFGLLTSVYVANQNKYWSSF